MIEPLKDILGSGGDYLNRIYLSTKLQNSLKIIHRDPVKVVIKSKVVTLVCSNSAQAAFWRLRRPRVYGEINNLLGKGHGFMVRVKIGAY